MTTRVAINGFGRIGRCVTRALVARGVDDLELVGINDLTDAGTLAHLLEFDSVHRSFPGEVTNDGDGLVINGKRVPISAERDPGKLPWKAQGVDVVMECTGIFRTKEQASAHLRAGAKRVIISAPGGADVDGTFCMGINTDSYDAAKHTVISNASCTTNCLAPMVKVLHEKFGIEKGHMVTVHSYTNDQCTLDLPHSDLRRARAAALSMIPTSTGAAKAIGLVMPELKGKLDGTSIRVPTPNVSITCLTAQVQTKTDRDEVNAAFEGAASGGLKGILGVEKRPLVSADFIGNPLSVAVDAAQTQVVGDDLVEVQGWYDNEWGFSNRMIDLARFLGERG
ncbi:MAG: type I glyceraldehyde-3-phosphate dehydrogenase [Myxococcales bacterium]|nr:type I glyceraldehyde-3-phosphate dehydrogenase [Myxococcales bacterium]